MHFKLLVALVEDSNTDVVIEAAREAGATGTTVITNASGEGIEGSTTFFGLTLETQRNVLLMLVEEHLSRHILETISEAGEFDTQKGAGMAFQVDVEDVVGITHQIKKLSETVEEVL
ncbi:MAG: Nitrogen regulatory protein P-II [uncultured Thiotrichaceae bacterium]|uniref:Nitrogen regulatory protein P-II n=1 Tax=uncultured Thiotrichaceae bacterium TaxID=298394 RepID=A0A6S6ULH4_9GAMM|nr:MAG: Nitrogen regulatory protein P-II [uncultured Thiotrichaceae bacterium]